VEPSSGQPPASAQHDTRRDLALNMYLKSPRLVSADGTDATPCLSIAYISGASRDRTGDLLVARQEAGFRCRLVLLTPYQSFRIHLCGSPGWNPRGQHADCGEQPD
jgi:hypothetical protein